MQKRMLLQVPEQKESAESEIRCHRTLSHDNVIKLVDSEIKDSQNGEGVALLVFPYYRVSTKGRVEGLLELFVVVLGT